MNNYFPIWPSLRNAASQQQQQYSPLYLSPYSYPYCVPTTTAGYPYGGYNSYPVFGGSSAALFASGGPQMFLHNHPQGGPGSGGYQPSGSPIVEEPLSPVSSPRKGRLVPMSSLMRTIARGGLKPEPDDPHPNIIASPGGAAPVIEEFEDVPQDLRLAQERDDDDGEAKSSVGEVQGGDDEKERERSHGEDDADELEVSDVESATTEEVDVVSPKGVVEEEETPSNKSMNDAEDLELVDLVSSTTEDTDATLATGFMDEEGSSRGGHDAEELDLGDQDSTSTEEIEREVVAFLGEALGAKPPVERQQENAGPGSVDGVVIPPKVEEACSTSTGRTSDEPEPEQLPGPGASSSKARAKARVKPRTKTRARQRSFSPDITVGHLVLSGSRKSVRIAGKKRKTVSKKEYPQNVVENNDNDGEAEETAAGTSSAGRIETHPGAAVCERLDCFCSKK